MKTVGDLINDIGTSDHYLSVAYGDTRTIKNAYDREAIIYAQAFSGIIVIFKKKGGYLAYFIFKERMGIHKWGEYLRSHSMEIESAIKEILKIKENGTGIVHMPDNEEVKKLIDDCIINNL